MVGQTYSFLVRINQHTCREEAYQVKGPRVNDTHYAEYGGRRAGGGGRGKGGKGHKNGGKKGGKGGGPPTHSGRGGGQGAGRAPKIDAAEMIGRAVRAFVA